ncbi:MAG: alpha/beta fold hydrolase [Gaiellaceae bacterium]
MLVHGSGSGPWIFDGWAAWFPGVRVSAVDLHAGRDAEATSMAGYAAVVAAAGRTLPRPMAVCGWSMGGLVALCAAARVRPAHVVLLEPSPPAEVQGFHPEIRLRPGSFDPEEAYGPFPKGMRARPASSLARDERKRGLSVPSLPCPSLVVYGKDFPDERGARIAGLYGSDQLAFDDLDHWGLVLDQRVPEALARSLGVAGGAG